MTAAPQQPEATVLALHHGYRTPGGEERAAAQLAEVAEQRLGERVAWVRRDSTRITAVDAARGLLAGGSGSSQVSEALRSSGADLLHAHNLFPTFGPAALEAAHEAGAAVVVHLHNYRLVCAVATNVRDGHDCTECRRGRSTPGLRHRCRGSLPEAAAYAAALPRWQRSVLDLADVVIVPSVAARTRLLDLGLGLPADRVHVIGGVAPQVATDSTASQGRYALLATRLAPEKDVRTAIDACRIAGIPLVIAGDGPERAALEAHAGPAAPAGAARAEPSSVLGSAVANAAPGTSAGAGRGPAGAGARDRRGARAAARRTDSTSERVRRPAVPPPPRDFPVHHNPFLSQATPPPSKAPPRAPDADDASTSGRRLAPEHAPEPPSPRPSGAERRHRPLQALLGPTVMDLLDETPTMHGTTVFLGRVSQDALVALRAGARIGLATSVAHETFGLSALESMAAGLPTAASAVGALPELVGHEHTVAPRNPQALAKLIGAIAGDDAVGRAAAARAAAHADPALIADRLGAAYAAAREHLGGRIAYR